MASPAASPVSFEASGVTGALSATHADLSKFNPLPTGGLLHNSLPPPPLPSLGRVLTPRTDPTGCEENGITLLANKYILLDQLEGSNLRRCIHVETHDQFVCKVRMVPFFWGGGVCGDLPHWFRKRSVIKTTQPTHVSGKLAFDEAT
jgi:hypothetical protein